MFFGPFIHYVDWFGTPAFRRWVGNHLPFRRLRDVKSVADTIQGQASSIFRDRKAALEADDDAMVHESDEGKDIMSVLRKPLNF